MAADAEFQESEIIFSDNNNYFLHFNDMDPDSSRLFYNSKKQKQKQKQTPPQQQQKKKSCSAASLPVNIPSNVYKLSDSDDFEEEYDDRSDEIVPPHVIIGRRIEGNMAFSVCTGIGRTLKGRDLSQVRNSILRLTGFLEV